MSQTVSCRLRVDDNVLVRRILDSHLRFRFSFAQYLNYICHINAGIFFPTSHCPKRQPFTMLNPRQTNPLFLHRCKIQFPRYLRTSLILHRPRRPPHIPAHGRAPSALLRQILLPRRLRLTAPPLMLEHAPRRDTITRVQHQHRHQEVHALVARRAERREVVVPAAHRVRRLRHRVLGQLAHAGPVVLGRRPDGLADQRDLVHLGVAGDVRRPDDELGEHEADAPDVYGARVVLRAEEQLGRAVPARDDVAGHHLVWIGEGAGETEIGELDLAIGGDQQVVGLDVAVQDEVLVAEPDGAREHAHPGLDVGGAVAHALDVADQHLEVAEREVLEHEVEVLVARREDRVQGDDVGVGELLQVLELAHGVGREPFGVFLLDLDFFDRDEVGRVGS